MAHEAQASAPGSLTCPRCGRSRHVGGAASVTMLNVASFAEAEPLYRRALVIWEKALGPEHQNIAITLENLAALLLKTNRVAVAAELWARAQAIRAKHARGTQRRDTEGVTYPTSIPGETDVWEAMVQ